MAYSIGQRHFAEWSDKALIRRQNPDGLSPLIYRAYYGTNAEVDISAVVLNNVAGLRLEVGKGQVQARNVDFSSVSDKTRVPVSKILSCLVTAGFTGVTFSIEADNAHEMALGRLKVVNSNPTTWPVGTVDALYERLDEVVQIQGDLAAVLGFGNCSLNHGKRRTIENSTRKSSWKIDKFC